MRTNLFILAICFSILTGAAQDFRSMINEASLHNTCEAFLNPEHPFWRMVKKADKGNLDALVCVGMCYLNGYYVPQSYSAALHYFEKVPYQGAAKNSKYNDLANYGKALCYFYADREEKPYRMKPDYVKSRKALEEIFQYYPSLNNEELAKAGFIYGECFYNGYGGDTEYNKAWQFYCGSASRGYKEARLKLGELVYEGMFRVTNENAKNDIIRYLTEEAEKGDSTAQFLAGILIYRLLLATDFENSDKNKRRAFKYLEMSSNNNCDRAKKALIRLFYLDRRDGEYADTIKAVNLLRELADKGDVVPQYMLGVLTLQGRAENKMVKRTQHTIIKEGLSWLKKSSKGGYKDATALLGALYYTGEMVERNDSCVMKYYTEYLKQKETAGQRAYYNYKFVHNILGELYYDMGDYENAVVHFRKAEEGEYLMLSGSARKYAICYKWGRGGLNPSDEDAELWMAKSERLPKSFKANLNLVFRDLK